MMTQEEKFEFLEKLEEARVYYSSGVYSDFSYNGSSLYFWYSSNTYDRFSWSEEKKILSYMDKIVRIDKKLDTEYYPLWTQEEGFVKEGDNFIKLKGKYYSATFLEKLIENIHNIKSIINLINT